MSATNRSSKFWALVVAPGLLLSLGVGGLLCFEALRVGPLAEPGVIESYHFGSESMVGVGGWRYTSRAVYVRSAAVEGICLVIVAAPFIMTVVRRRAAWAVGGYIGLGLVFLITSQWRI